MIARGGIQGACCMYRMPILRHAWHTTGGGGRQRRAILLTVKASECALRSLSSLSSSFAVHRQRCIANMLWYTDSAALWMCCARVHACMHA
eukprot:364947-Chlamydomonas_euryale.AAC.4